MFDFSFINAFLKAPFLVKGIMVLLVLGSLWSWTIIFYQFFNLKKQRQQEEQIKQKIRGKDLYKYFMVLQNRTTPKTGLDAIIYAGYEEISRFKNSSTEILINAEKRMFLAVEKERQVLQLGLNSLATIGSVSPYVGLLGTVFGIIHAFRLLGGLQQVAINVVAPGIAEALITTALGLLVAIPAVMAFNFLGEKLDRLIEGYKLYAQELSLHFKRELLMYQATKTLQQGSRNVQNEE